MNLLHLMPLAARSAWNRRATLALTVLAIALSVCLLLGVERLRQGVKEGFTQSVSGADLVVGARGSPLQLMLYAVFHLGEATHNLGWPSVQALSAHPAVAWAIPLSLGDSHRGYPVLGTSQAYFDHFRHGDRQALRLAKGRAFRDGPDDLFSAVLGAEVAEALGYRLGDRLTLSHGSGEPGLAEHADKPFTVAGILARTGTPVDRAVHISLQGLEAIHLDWQGGAPIPGVSIPAQFARKFDLTPKSVTAVILGLESRAAVFSVQRYVNGYRDEPLMAVLPGVALAQLWEVVGVGEQALLAVSGLVVAVGLAGLVAVVLAGLNERRRELAILRSVGAGPLDILWLLTLEGLGLTLAGAALGVILLTGLGLAAGPWIAAHYGIVLAVAVPTAGEATLLGSVVAVGLLASLLPGWRAYRLSLADGLTPRI
ncbi:MAG TPA: ABC transporter permease [Thiobacillaceae bacterium]|nr:ABC transporter permease [Thiobacillaceae bacterium]